MAIVTRNDSFTQVHKYHAGSAVGCAFVALFLQAFLPRYIPHAEILELPLLVAVYFGISRRNPSSGLLLGLVIGLLQDAIANLPLGVYGIALTVVGYCSSWIGARIDIEHAYTRFLLTFVLYNLEQLIIASIRRNLLAQPGPLFNGYWLTGSVLAALLAAVLFPQLDRLQKS